MFNSSWSVRNSIFQKFQKIAGGGRDEKLKNFVKSKK